jgi:hypothetical protein
MSYGLDQLLSYVALGKPIEKVKNGIPDPLPEFSAIKGTAAIGDVKRFMTYRGTRLTAKRVEYNAPSLRGTHTAIGEQDVKCLTAKENLPIDGSMLIKMRSMDKYQADMGKDWLAITTRNFTTLFDNLRKAQRWMILANGTTYFDSNGNLLPSSAGALAVGAGSIDISVAAGHKNQGTDSAGNAIIDISWDNSQSNIPLQLETFQQEQMFQTGFDIEYALYSKEIPSYFSTNDFCLDYLARNPTFNDAFVMRGKDGQGTLPDGLFGIKRWIPTNRVFYDTEDANGTLTHRQIFPANSLTLCPKPNQDWYEQVEGTTLVPTTFNATADLGSAIASGRLVEGMWGYGLPQGDPFGATLFYGDVFLAFVKNPDVLWNLTVKF